MPMILLNSYDSLFTTRTDTDVSFAKTSWPMEIVFDSRWANLLRSSVGG